MANTPVIRPATAHDAEALQDLYTHLSSDNERCPTDLAKGNLTRLEAFEGSAVLIGQLGADIITSCTLIVIPNLTRGGAPYALIENVVTHADQRGRGFGKQILRARLGPRLL